MATKKASSSVRKLTSKKSAMDKETKHQESTVKVVPAASKSGSTGIGSVLGKAPFIVALVAELVGTFLLASAYIASQGQPLYILFAVIGIVLFIGTISGAHINPAVTIGSLITRKIKAGRALGYLIAQFLGAALALIVLGAFVGGAAEVSAEAALYGQTAASLFSAEALTEGKEWYVFFSEALGTLIIGFAFASALSKRQGSIKSAATIGLGVFVALMIAYTAASYVGATAILNPAVALSLSALSWQVWPLAIYILAPVIGGVLGFAFFEILKSKGQTVKE